MNLLEFASLKPCRYDAWDAVPKQRVRFDFPACWQKLQAGGYELVADVGVMLVVRKGVEVTLYRNGRLLMHPVRTKEHADQVAQEIYRLVLHE